MQVALLNDGPVTLLLDTAEWGSRHSRKWLELRDRHAACACASFHRWFA